MLFFYKKYYYEFNLIYYLFLLKSDGLFYLKNIILIIVIDFLIIDDEPIWEPLEWTIIQTWLLFIFLFSWVAETIITSKFGSFSGRDKRVYMGLFKNYWLIEFWFMFNLVITGLFVITPFFFELNYNLSYVNTWWDWINRFFFYKIFFIFIPILLISNILIISNRWLNFYFQILLIFLLLLLLFFIFYFHFILLIFSYFTDLNYYKKYNWMSYFSLSKGPLKWGWGEVDRDFFTYHSTSSNFWFKNNSSYASIFLLINLFIFLSIFLLIIQTLMIFRSLIVNKFISYTFLNFLNSNLKQFFIFFIFLFFFILVSFNYQFLRFPNELLYSSKFLFFFNNIKMVLYNYLAFLINFFN